MIFVENVDRVIVVNDNMNRTLSIRKDDYQNSWTTSGHEMRRIMPGQTVLLILIATLRKSDIRVHRGKNVADSTPVIRIIAIRLATLNRANLILTCNINRVLYARTM